MRPNILKTCLAVVAAALAVGLPAGASAQDFPGTREIRVVSGFPPGTGPDTATRYIAEMLRKASGATVIVENRPGALGNVASQYVSRAKPDGYTVYVTAGSSSFAINSYLFTQLQFDPIKDFTPITSMWKGAFGLAVADDSPHKTLQDLTAELRAKKTGIKFGYHSAIGLTASTLYLKRIGIEGTAVSYRSSPDAHTGLAQHEFDFMATDLSPMMVPNRRTRPLAVTSTERTKPMADVPSAKEGGLDDYDLTYWWGLWLPPGAPANIVTTYTKWIEPGLKSDEFAKFFAALGAEPFPDLRGEALREYTVREAKKWNELMTLAKVEKQ